MKKSTSQEIEQELQQLSSFLGSVVRRLRQIRQKFRDGQEKTEKEMSVTGVYPDLDYEGAAEARTAPDSDAEDALNHHDTIEAVCGICRKEIEGARYIRDEQVVCGKCFKSIGNRWDLY